MKSVAKKDKGLKIFVAHGEISAIEGAIMTYFGIVRRGKVTTSIDQANRERLEMRQYIRKPSV